MVCRKATQLHLQGMLSAMDRLGVRSRVILAVMLESTSSGLGVCYKGRTEPTWLMRRCPSMKSIVPSSLSIEKV